MSNDQATTQETEQSEHETGSEAWIDEALARKRVQGFVISLASAPTEDQQRTIEAKERFLLAYELSMGSIKEACKRSGVGRTTFYEWRQSDPEFLADVRQIDHMRVEMAEDGIFQLMQNGDGPTLRWYLERVTEKYKARKILEHHTDDKTFEDEIDAIIAQLEEAEKTPHGTTQHTNTEPTHQEQEAPASAHGDKAADPQ